MGCASGGDGDGNVLRDDVGREVTVPSGIQRIVSLAPSMTEVAFAAGLGDLLVGVTTADDYPESVRELPAISALPVDFEAVASLRPDLVIATDHVNSTRDIRTFDRLGIPVYFFRFDEIGDIPRAMRVLGRLTGRESIADSAAAGFEHELERLRSGSSRSGASEPPPSVLFLIDSEVLYSVGEGSYVNNMIAIAGGRSVTAEISSPAPVLTDEFVISVNPDVIVGTFGTDFSLDAILRQRPSWANLEAVRSGRVHSVPGDLFHRPGPRVLEGISSLNDLLRDE